MNVRPRINSSSLSIENSVSSLRNTNFGNKVGIGFGLEAEFVLPFNKNKWAIAIEPTYQNYKVEKIKNSGNVVGGELRANINYSSIEIPVTLRHYLFLNKDSKLFLNTSLVFGLPMNSSIDFTRNDGSNISSLEVSSTNNLAFGIGYKFKRYGVELQYHKRDILSDFISWKSNHETLSIVFGYSILHK